MGEACKEALRVGFDSQIKRELPGAAITSDAGLVAYRELRLFRQRLDAMSSR